MIATMEELWTGVEKAPIFESGVFFRGGFDGVVKVERTIVKETRKNGVAFIVEFKIIESNMDEHPVGSKGTWYQGLTNKDVAFPAIMAWIAACAGYSSSQKAAIDEAVRPVAREMLVEASKKPDDNFFIGIVLRLRTRMKKTKEKNMDFTVHDFEPYETVK